MSKVIKYGDNIDTDAIIPARYLNLADRRELAAHAMEDLDAAFVEVVRPGDVLAAGCNFGCGSSREHAPRVLKDCGIALVVAESFARIFYRNAINIGLPIVECPQAARQAASGDHLSVDFESGVLTNHTQGTTYAFSPFPAFVQRIIAAGGLVALVKSGGLV